MGNIPCRIIDLDSVIVSGNKRYCAPYKRGSNEFSFGGIQYLMEIIANGYTTNCATVVLCRDIQLADSDSLADDLLSYREAETLMQYEICYEKLSMTGVKVMLYETQQELWDDMFALTKQAAYDNPLARVYTNHIEDIAGLINLYDTLYIYTSTKVFTRENVSSIVSDIVIPYNAYDLYTLLNPYIHNRALLEYLIGYYKKMIDNVCYKVRPSTAKESVEHYRNKTHLRLFLDQITALTEEDVKNLEKEIQTRKEREDGLKTFKLEAFKSINEKGMSVFLGMLRFSMIAEYLGVDPRPKLGYSDYNYISEKIDRYFNNDYSLENSLGLPTNFFSSEEKITLKNADGKLVHSKTVKDTEYLDDADADDFLSDFRG